MTADDLAPLSELFRTALRVLTDSAPQSQGLVFAFGGPAWAAFWLGRFPIGREEHEARLIRLADRKEGGRTVPKGPLDAAARADPDGHSIAP